MPLKTQRVRQWCEDINAVQAEAKFVYVDEEELKQYAPKSFASPSLLDGFRKYKE